MDPGKRGRRDLVPPTLAAGSQNASPGRDDDLVGTTLGGRYRILRRLGEGAMGNVYLGEHLKIGRQDAIKVLRDDLATDRDAIARFLRGTRNVSAIRHPNVCTIYDYSDTADGLQFVAMEFVPGETLKDLLQRVGVLPLERAAEIAVQTADALDAAHAAGIVHRDLKPANIMVMQSRTGADQVKVVDFDIAKGRADGDEEEVTRLGFVIGTPEYMSPEQLVGERLDGRSDVYSLALVLFRMLTGKLPFDMGEGQEVILRRLTERPLLLAEAASGTAFPESLERVIHKALARRPQDRYSSAMEFGRAVAAAVGHAGVSVGHRAFDPPASAYDEPLPETRVDQRSGAPGGGAVVDALRKKWMTRAIAVAGTLAASIGGGMMLLQRDDPEQQIAQAALVQEPMPSAAVTEPTATADPPPEQNRAQEGSGSGEQRTPSTASGGGGAPPAAPIGVPSTPGGQATPPPDVVIEDAQGVLFGLLDRLADPNASRSIVSAVRDTAALLFDQPGAATIDRAFAAYVLGNALLPLGDTVGSVSWLEQAVRLRPNGPGYQELLDTYRQLLNR